MEGPLGYRWLIRLFDDIHCRQSRNIFISIVGPSDSKYADRDTILSAVCVCPGLWRDLRYKIITEYFRLEKESQRSYKENNKTSFFFSFKVVN